MPPNKAWKRPHKIAGEAPPALIRIAFRHVVEKKKERQHSRQLKSLFTSRIISAQLGSVKQPVAWSVSAPLLAARHQLPLHPIEGYAGQTTATEIHRPSLGRFLWQRDRRHVRQLHRISFTSSMASQSTQVQCVYRGRWK